MKISVVKNLLFVVILCLTVEALSQQIDVEGIVNVSTTPSPMKISKSYLQGLGKTKSSFTQKYKDLTVFKGQYYKVDDMILRLSAERITTPKDFIERRKKGNDRIANSLSSIGPKYSSEIRNYNGNQVLIVHDVYKILDISFLQ